MAVALLRAARRRCDLGLDVRHRWGVVSVALVEAAPCLWQIKGPRGAGCSRTSSRRSLITSSAGTPCACYSAKVNPRQLKRLLRYDAVANATAECSAEAKLERSACRSCATARYRHQATHNRERSCYA